jgi:DNA-directed RNA polymerase subunit RPC12/RpoP
MAQRTAVNSTDGVCPYCGGKRFWNSWGRGNACCCDCEREFNVEVADGRFVGHPLEEAKEGL